jgi:hypothetical protein
MADDKTILLKVELDVTELQKSQKVAAKEVEKLIKEKETLKNATEKDTIAIAKNKEQLRLANKVLRDSTKALNTNVDSVGRAKAANAILRAEKDKVNETTKEGQKRIESINKQLDKNNEIIEKNASKLGKQKIGVGRYEKGLNSLRASLIKVGGAFGVAFGVSAVTSMVKELSNLSDEAKGIEFAFDRIGERGVQAFNDVKAATRGTLSDLDIKQSLVDFDNFGISLEQSGDLFEFLTVRATQTGTSIDKLKDSLVEGLSKESKLRIDNLGISMSQLNAEMEKTPNFVEAVANIAKTEIAEAGDILDSAASGTSKWNAQLENLKLKLANDVSPGLDALKTTAANGLGFIVENFETILSVVGKVAKALLILKGVMTINKIVDQWKNYKISISESGEAAKEASGKFGKLKGAINAIKVSVLVFAFTELVSVFKDVFSGADRLERQLQSNQETQEKFNQTLQTSINSRREQIETFKGTNAARAELVKGLKEETLAEVERLKILAIDEAQRAARIRGILNESDITGQALKSAEAARLTAEKTGVNLMSAAQEQILGYLDAAQQAESNSRALTENISKLAIEYGELGEEVEAVTTTTEDSTKADKEKTKEIKRQIFAVLELAKVNTENSSKLSSNLDKEFESGKKRLSALAAIGVAEAELFGTREAQTEARIKQIEVERDNDLNDYSLQEAERVRIKYEAELQIKAIREEGTKNAASEAAKETQILSDENAKRITIALNSEQQLAAAAFQIKQNAIQAELNADKEKFDTQTQLLNDQLDAGLISQAEFDAKKSALDSKANAKEKKLKEEAFKADRAAKLVSAGINVALGITSALTIPPPAGAILAGVTAALGAVEIAAIASAPTPKFEKGGGLFGGKPHSQGGTKGYFDDGTQIEVEKDEMFFILNKNAKNKIGALDHLNQSTGGVPLMENGGVMKFAGGGSLVSQASQNGNNSFNQSQQLNAAVQNMPPVFVAVTDINTGQGNYANVVDRANF